MKNISVGFLVFNENESLKQTILRAHSSLKKFTDDFEIWVFDNDSSDGSSQTVKDLSNQIDELVLYKQSKNKGYAQNLYSAINKMNANYIFVIDGDGQYDVDDVRDAIKLLQRNDVIFGVRSPRNDPILRVLMSYFLGVLSKIILGSDLRDINCGFRGFKQEASKKIKINYNYNFVGPEVYTLSKLNNLNICEMKIKHYKRISGISYFNGFFKIILSCITMIKYLFQLRKILKKD